MLAISVTGCSLIHPTKYTCIANAPKPPTFLQYCHKDQCDYKRYADDLNWYMIYLFTYTKAVNEFVLTKGWKLPSQPPICRAIVWPKPEKFPEFKPSTKHTSADEFEWELTQYIKRLRKIYSAHTYDIENAVTLQKTLCTY